MPTYLSPGVYVEEVPPMVRPISGVGTSTAGFLGVVADNVTMPQLPGHTGTTPADYYPVAPAAHPTLLTSWSDFRNQFGDFQAGNQQLANAVYGFFNNGGTRCWVQRAADAAALTDPSALLEAFEAVDEIAIVAMPGAVTDVQHTSLIAHCAKMTDRVAILDGAPSPGLVPAEICPVGRSAQASYAGLYFPWITVFDPVANAPAQVPPSGHLAGIYAATDAARGVFKAPANVAVTGALDVATKITQSQQDGLNPVGINVIRSFTGTVTVWGARTLADDNTPEFRYVSTRRYFNYLRESIIAGTRWVVFEPNSPSLWQRVIRNVSDFLVNEWQAGGLFGTTAAQSFYVRCDATTNTPDVRALGQLVTEVGVAIVQPAEFVIFRVEQISGS